ncbi:unnamed protein product [Anisakis simplex]|nr:unnamed protein product [Anisakis simplex]
MLQNFTTKNRGPQKRIAEPKVYDNFCDLDVWILKRKGTVECDGACFKWQQIIDNSGSYSYMTMRSCYNEMFDMKDPLTAPEPDDFYCSSK